MNFIKRWVQAKISRRSFIFLTALGLYRFLSGPTVWARARYVQVKEFLIRSIEGTQRVDLKTWRLKIEGLVDKPTSLSLDEIKALPQKIQTKDFICVEGWGLNDQKWEGVHLKEIFAKVQINPKANFITFHAAGGQYTDSLSIKEALEPDTMLAYKVNGNDLPPENGFPLRLIVPRMYAYKGVKWVEKIVFTEKQEIGYWEQGGYPVDGVIPGLKG
ncbi:MAG TPA: molybdopterin-dependent oxidoreductase [Thermodesulfobacteriota bacterium]|nr:molybdopterin-dependent oxidoreductase [Thermodesulfobacteriota bacterium]